MDIFSILSENFSSCLTFSEISFFSNLFSLKNDEANIDFQELSYKRLNFLIDSILEIRYKESKSSFIFSDIADINSFLQKNFSVLSLNDICSVIYEFVGSIVSIESIYSDISYLYDIFLAKGFIDLTDTHSFCTKYLNLHRDSYFMNERNNIYNCLANEMRLSNRVENSLLNSIKFKQVSELFLNTDFSNSFLFKSRLSDFKSGLLSNKKLKKYSSDIDRSFDIILKIFIDNGRLDIDLLKHILPMDDKSLNYICKKFEDFKFRFVDCISLPYDDLSYDVSNIGFNYNNFMIFDNNRYINNLVSVMSRINSSCAKRIISNKDYLSKIVYLVSFVGLFKELSCDKFVDIMLYADSIYSDGRSVKNYCDLYCLSNKYSNINKLQCYALGNDVCSIIDTCKANEYMDFYLDMNKRNYSFIPPISFVHDDFLYESGVISDLNRLLIGNTAGTYSCIKLGSSSYSDILLSDSNDVLLVKRNGKLVSRIFIFRRGNVIQLVTNYKTKFPISIFEKISSEIISCSSDDNIDFVFVNSSSCSDSRISYPIVSDNRFVTEFPYADLFNSSIMLYGTDYNKANYNVDFKNCYLRKRASINLDASIDDVIRLRAYNLCLNNNYDISFLDSYFSLSYSRVICGEDWYIIIYDDGSIDEFLLDNASECSFDEIDFVKRNYLSNKKLILK